MDTFAGLKDLAEYAKGLFQHVAPDYHKRIYDETSEGHAGGSGDGASQKKRSEMTAAEKAAYIGEHGIDKFMDIPA